MLTRAIRSSSSCLSVPAGRKVHFTTGKAAFRRRWDTTQERVIFWPSWATVKGDGVMVTLMAKHKSGEASFRQVILESVPAYNMQYQDFGFDRLMSVYHKYGTNISWKACQSSGCRLFLNKTGVTLKPCFSRLLRLHVGDSDRFILTELRHLSTHSAVLLVLQLFKPCYRLLTTLSKISCKIKHDTLYTVHSFLINLQKN